MQHLNSDVNTAASISSQEAKPKTLRTWAIAACLFGLLVLAAIAFGKFPPFFLHIFHAPNFAYGFKLERISVHLFWFSSSDDDFHAAHHPDPGHVSIDETDGIWYGHMPTLDDELNGGGGAYAATFCAKSELVKPNLVLIAVRTENCPPGSVNIESCPL
jgi:hypothetical protein